jgi:hypothetical protein
MSYLDNTVDNATDYKGKLDESVNLLREPPVTAGSATAYTVAGWASLTLTDGIVYTAKAHATNTGAVTVAGVSTTNLDASALSAGQIQQNQMIHLLYQSSGPSFLLLNPSSKTLVSPTISGGTIDNAVIGGTTAAEATITQATIKNSVGNIYLEATTGGTNEKRWLNQASATALFWQTRTDANAAGQIWLQVDRTGTIIDTINFANGTLQSGGNYVGVVVYNQALDPGSSFTSGNGWLTVVQTSITPTYQCTYTALDVWAHVSSSGVTTTGAPIPAAYRPNSNIQFCHYMGSDGIGDMAIKSSGNISVDYRDWAGSVVQRTTIGNSFSISWVAGGS